MARPTKLTPQVQAAIVQAVAGGNTRKTAALYAGVSTTVIRNWIIRGKSDKKGIYVAFLAAVKKAEADATVRNVALIQKAANKSWQAAAWWLERKLPDEWGRDRNLLKQLIEKTVELERLARERSAKPGTNGTHARNGSGRGDN